MVGELPSLDWLAGRLQRGERLLWSGRQGRRWFFFPLIGTLGGLLVTIAAGSLGAIGSFSALLEGDFSTIDVGLVAVAAATAIVFGFGALIRLAKGTRKTFAITNRRLFVYDERRRAVAREIERWEIDGFSVKPGADGSGSIRIALDCHTDTSKSLLASSFSEDRDKAKARIDLIDVPAAASAQAALETMLRESEA